MEDEFAELGILCRHHKFPRVLMARTLESIQREIDKLQKEAEAVRAKEVVGVIEKIKTAIDFYRLTPADLFSAEPQGKKVSKGEKGKLERKARAKAATKGAPRPVKYRGEAGETWGGMGKRPDWFKAALAAGKTPADMMVATSTDVT